MSEGRAQQELGPYSFEMTEEDARVAASRAGLRAALSGRLSRNHVAPLVAFALLMAFVTILTLTGLIGRRLGEGALILARDRLHGAFGWPRIGGCAARKRTVWRR